MKSREIWIDEDDLTIYDIHEMKRYGNLGNPIYIHYRQVLPDEQDEIKVDDKKQFDTDLEWYCQMYGNGSPRIKAFEEGWKMARNYNFKFQLDEIEKLKEEIKTFERADRIEANSFEERCSEASHYNWLDDQNEDLKNKLLIIVPKAEELLTHPFLYSEAALRDSSLKARWDALYKAIEEIGEIE